MNILDYIIIAFLIFLVLRGIFRGYMREIFSLVGVIIGIWIGNMYQPWMTAIIKQHLPFPKYLPLLSFIIIFASVLVICNIIGWIISLFSKKTPMRWTDITFGSLLALVKGVILTYLAIVLFTFYLPEKAPIIANSTLAPWIVKSYQKTTSIISPNHYTNWKKKFVGETKKISDTVSGKIKDLVQDDE